MRATKRTTPARPVAPPAPTRPLPPFVTVCDPRDVMASSTIEADGDVDHTRLFVELRSPEDEDELSLDVFTGTGRDRTHVGGITLPRLQMRVVMALAAMIAEKAHRLGYWPTQDEAPDFDPATGAGVASLHELLRGEA